MAKIYILAMSIFERPAGFALFFALIAGAWWYARHSAQRTSEALSAEETPQLTNRAEALSDSAEVFFRRANAALERRDCRQAIPALRSFIRVRGVDDPDAWGLLGKCYLEEGHADSALAALRKAASTGDRADLSPWIARAEQLVREERDMGRVESPHFSLQVEGKAHTWQAADSLLERLERVYDRLTVVWNHYPRHKIPAVFYERRRMGDGALPDWIGALYDGKVRIPYEALSRGDEVERVLTHEIAHAFARDMASGAAIPPWLDEGLAQYLDGSSWNPRVLSAGPPDWSDLRRNFLEQNNEREALRLYQTALGMFRLFLEKYARGDFAEVRLLLTGLGEGLSADEVMRARWGVTPEELYREFTQQLKGAYVSEHINPQP